MSRSRSRHHYCQNKPHYRSPELERKLDNSDRYPTKFAYNQKCEAPQVDGNPVNKRYGNTRYSSRRGVGCQLDIKSQLLHKSLSKILPNYEKTNMYPSKAETWGELDGCVDDVRPSMHDEYKPNFGSSGKLSEDIITSNGVTIKYAEPPEARNPIQKWLWHVFKNGTVLDEPLPIYRSSCYLIGRERRIAGIPTDHPSCSGQHAVLQYRCIEELDGDNKVQQVIKPYIVDIGSVNGTFLNGERIESARYYELLEKDVLRFGNSSREYVLLHSDSV